MHSPQVGTIPDVRLHLDVDYAGLRWSGRVEYPAAFLTTAPVLDAEGLEIRSAHCGGRPVRFSATGSSVALELPSATGPNETVAVEFSGRIETKSLYGFYRSPHGDGYVLTTHCEPAGARKIFPCVDRPDRKLRLRLTVRTDAALEVVANAPARPSPDASATRTWEFDPTPPMSTYLFYLAVGRFDRCDSPPGRVALRVLTPPGRGESGRWAAEMGPKVLAACEAYYGIPYPLPKLDLIAIAEHAFGAMENWGAISFHQSRLLYDAASGSFSQRDIVETTAHEIAHQWFGNLVTMAWWDDIWLNESFASLMETKITERIAPEFEPWTDFFLRTAGTALALDADSLSVTHPIRARVERPEELSQIFDEISYGKGASVLGMLDHFLGEEKFRAGVRSYLEKFRYANARTEDLWASLEQASGESVAAIAGPWTDRPGLPLLTARLGPEGLELTQRRFAYLGVQEEEPWPIPLVVDVDGTARRIRMDGRRLLLPVPADATVHLNPGAIGFYRVLYDEPLFERLLRALPRRPPADRWTVVQDLSAFLLSGDVSWATVVRAARALRETDDRLVVEGLVGAVAGVALDFPDLSVPVRDARELLRHFGERFGTDPPPNESPTSGIVRDRVAFARVRLDPAYAAELAPRFDRWGEVDANVRSAVAVARVAAGGAEGFRDVLGVLRRGAASAVDAVRLSRALAWSGEPACLEELLDLATRGEINRSNVTTTVTQASINPTGRALLWPWLTRRLPELTEMFRGSGYLPILLDQVLPLVGLGREAEVRRFFQEHPSEEGARGLAKGLERLELLGRLRGRLVQEA